MKTLSITEARDGLSDAIETSQKTPVLLLRHGKPVAVLRGVEGFSIDELYKSELHDDIRQARREIAQGKGIPLKEVAKELGLKLPPVRRKTGKKVAARKVRRRKRR